MIGPFSASSQALSFIEAGNPLDAAILDVDLHGKKSYSVTQALMDRHVRFVFATGYGDDGIDPVYRFHPSLQKPIDESMLVRVLLSEHRD